MLSFGISYGEGGKRSIETGAKVLCGVIIADEVPLETANVHRGILDSVNVRVNRGLPFTLINQPTVRHFLWFQMVISQTGVRHLMIRSTSKHLESRSLAHIILSMRQAYFQHTVRQLQTFRSPDIKLSKISKNDAPIYKEVASPESTSVWILTTWQSWPSRIVTHFQEKYEIIYQKNKETTTEKHINDRLHAGLFILDEIHDTRNIRAGP